MTTQIEQLIEKYKTRMDISINDPGNDGYDDFDNGYTSALSNVVKDLQTLQSSKVEIKKSLLKNHYGHCPKCESDVWSDHKYCINCGKINRVD